MSGERERERARDALERAKSVRDDSTEEFKKHYRSYVEGLGATIVMNGLGQALATELAAAGGDQQSPHRRLYENLDAWLRKVVYQDAKEGKDVLQAVLEHGQDEYLRAQTEALAWLGWHKKFCQAYLPRAEGRN